MRLKITAKGNVNDLQTGESFTFGDTLERDPKRAQAFLDKGIAVEVKEKDFSEEIKKEIPVKDAETVEAPETSVPEKPKKKRKAKKA